MAQRLAGPGVGLPLAQNLYPAQITGIAYTASTNKLLLPTGSAFVLPAGRWICAGGTVTCAQYLDPVTQQWLNINAPGASWGLELFSDGFNIRIANISGVATGATVTAPGSGYVQATAAVAPSAGNSTWVPIIGGALGAITIGAGGSNYSVLPQIFFAAPAYPGIQATGHATLTSGAVSAITLDNAGAGYLSPPSIVIVPSPTDPNLGIITNATATVVLAGAGTLTGVLLTDFGTPETAAPTLTVSGGTGATATVLPAVWVAEASDTITLQPAP